MAGAPGDLDDREPSAGERIDLGIVPQAFGQCAVRADEQQRVEILLLDEPRVEATARPVDVPMAGELDGREPARDRARRRDRTQQVDAVGLAPEDRSAGFALRGGDAQIDLGPLVGTEQAAERLDVLRFAERDVGIDGELADRDRALLHRAFVGDHQAHDVVRHDARRALRARR